MYENEVAQQLRNGVRILTRVPQNVTHCQGLSMVFAIM